MIGPWYGFGPFKNRPQRRGSERWGLRFGGYLTKRVAEVATFNQVPAENIVPAQPTLYLVTAASTIPKIHN
jgi:hypothetical protein